MVDTSNHRRIMRNQGRETVSCLNNLNRKRVNIMTKSTKATNPMKATKATKTAKAPKIVIKVPKKSLEVIATTVHSHIAKVGTATFDIGTNLLLAKGHFLKDSGVVNATEWLVWVEKTFNIKKAQANNYVKIVQVFGKKKEFQGLATQVLSDLMRSEKMTKEAKKELDKGNTITTAWTKAYKAEQDEKSGKAKKKRDLDKKNAKIKAELEAQEAKINAPITISKERLEKAKASIANEAKALTALQAAMARIKELEAENAELKKSSAVKTKSTKPVAKPLTKKAKAKQEATAKQVKERLNTIIDIENKVKMKDKSVMTKSGKKFKKTFQERANPTIVSSLGNLGLTERYQKAFNSMSA